MNRSLFLDISSNDFIISQSAMIEFIDIYIQPQIDMIYNYYETIDIPSGYIVDGFESVGVSNSIDWNKSVFYNMDVKSISYRVNKYVYSFMEKMREFETNGTIMFKQRILTFEDTTLHRHRMAGVYGWCEPLRQLGTVGNRQTTVA